jgi:hypothetical protein
VWNWRLMSENKIDELQTWTKLSDFKWDDTGTKISKSAGIGMHQDLAR